MTAPSQSTCAPWADVGDVCSPCNDYDVDLPALADWIQVASDVLFDLTRRRWPGLCSETVRPCQYRDGCWCGCRSPRSCSCRRLSEIALPGPVASVSEVKIDGVVISPARYRIDDYRLLVYLPDPTETRQGWPCCQRLDLDDTETDTWSVTYEFGLEPPLGGVKAAADLGCQYLVACDPEAVDAGLCRLPNRVVSEVRQGVSISLADPSQLVAEGLTGLDTVDGWVAAVNRGVAMRPARFWHPSHRRQQIRRVGT